MKPSENNQRDQLLQQHIKDLKKQVKEKKKLLKKEQLRFQAQDMSREQNQNQNQYDIQDLIESQQELLKQTTRTAQICHLLFNNAVYSSSVTAENVALGMEEKRQRILEEGEQKEEALRQTNPRKKIKQNEGNQVEVENREEDQNIQGLIDMSQKVHERRMNENTQNEGIQLIQEQNESNSSESNNGNDEMKQKQQEKEEQLQLYCDWEPYDHHRYNQPRYRSSYFSYQEDEEEDKREKQLQRLQKFYKKIFEQDDPQDSQRQLSIDEFKYYFPNVQFDQNYRKLPAFRSKYQNDDDDDANYEDYLAHLRIQTLINRQTFRKYRKFNC